MKLTKLYDLVYDRLANNTENEMFEPEMADTMELVYNADSHEAEYMTIEIDGTTYVLTISELNGGERS